MYLKLRNLILFKSKKYPPKCTVNMYLFVCVCVYAMKTVEEWKHEYDEFKLVARSRFQFTTRT